MPLTDDQLWASWLCRPAVPEGEDDSMESQIVGYARAVIAAATQANVSEPSAVAAEVGKAVARVKGFDPLDPTKGAHLPMVPSSWRFGFWRANGGLEFRRLDEGEFVIWDSVKDAVFASMAKPGDWPEDFGHENGQYLCTCVDCSRVFTAHKRRVVCKLCAHPEAAPQAAVPDGAQYLFIELGELDDLATIKWCRNLSEVRFAVRDAMYMTGYNLSDEDNEIIDANLQELLDTGGVTFEGDSGLELIRVRAAPLPTAQEAEPAPEVRK